VRVLGIDLAASPATTGVVVLEPDPECERSGRWRARASGPPADDDQLVELTQGAIAVGVDAPLGWPDAFVDAVARHRDLGPWPGSTDRTTLTHRVTDHRTRPTVGRLPLSVSADLLGVVGMRCALLQRRWADEVWGSPAPRDGSGVLSETYPVAAFAAWGIASRGYKARQRPAEASAVRAAIVATVASATSSWLTIDDVADECVVSDHVLDALACALVAVAVRAGSTAQPADADRAISLREGWIHVPTVPLESLASPSGG
jgi:predicted nuclease with RNAse H fold